MGRHIDAEKQKRAALLRWTGIGALVAAVGLATALVGSGMRGEAQPRTSTTGAAPTGPCGTLVVGTTRELAKVVAGQAQAMGTTCPSIEVKTVEAQDFVEAASRGTEVPDVWIPDSDKWVQTAKAAIESTEGTLALTTRGQLGSSPVVLVIPQSLVSPLNTGAQSWVSALATTPVVASSPAESTASMLAFASVWQALEGNRLAQGAMGDAFFQVVRGAVPPEQLFGFVAKAKAGARAFPASEQQLFAFHAEHPDARFGVLTPSSGSASLVYQYVVVGDQDERKAQVSSALFERLTGSEGQGVLRAAGLRVGTPSEPLVAGIPVTLPGSDPGISYSYFNRIRLDWNRILRDTRLLMVVDVSGSMREKVGTTTRITLAGDAVANAVSNMPPTSQAGLWVFSSNLRAGKLDWTEVVPMGTIGAGGTKRAVMAAADRLPSMTKGDTGLYDTIWAAYSQQQNTAMRGVESMVVVVTDGKNDDPTGGLSEAQLIAKLKGVRDAERPVRLVLIGMGDADTAVMRRVTQAIQGLTVVAKNPAELTGVFASAVWQVSPGSWK